MADGFYPQIWPKTRYFLSFDDAKKQCVKVAGKGGISVVNEQGQLKSGIMMSSPATWSLGNHLLLLTYEEPRYLKEGNPYVVFIGGFDPEETVRDKDIETRFLALMYPAENFDTLVKTLGSVDFVPGTS